MRRDLAALIVAMTFPSVMAYVYFVALGGPPTDGSANRAVQLTYATSKVVQFAFPVVYLALVRPEALRPGRPRAAGLWIGALFGIVVGVTIVALADRLATTVLLETPTRVRRKVVEFGAGDPGRFIALAVFLSVVHSLLEEYYWRWFVFGGLRRFARFWPAAVLSGVAFAGHHIFVLNEYLPGQFWSAVVPFSLAIAAGGVVWAWLYERTGSLLGPWISHFFVDFGIMAAGYRMLFIPNAA